MAAARDIEFEFRRIGDFNTMARIFLALCLAAVVAVPTASYSNDLEVWINAAGLGYAVFLAAGLSGGLLGFIFSVPYVNKVTTFVEPESPKDASDTQIPKPVLVQRQPLLRSNSNLEKISEWLTTMLVGVGLSQLNSVFIGLQKFGEFLAPLDIVKSGEGEMIVGNLEYVGPPILVAGLAMGFLSVYLYTRLRISYLFLHVEQEFNADAEEDAPLSVQESKAVTTIFEKSSLKENPSVKAMTSVGSTSVRDALAVMTQFLYDVKGSGYRQAIEIGEELQATPAASVARYWFLMAAAHGQEYAEAKSSGAPEEVLRVIKAKVLNAIDTTLALDPRYKRTFNNMLDRNNVDNDLKSFADQEDVVSRLR
jgi:hypothetical protein